MQLDMASRLYTPKTPSANLLLANPSHNYQHIILVILLLLLSPWAASADQVRYDGHKVYRVIPQTEEHMSLVKTYLQNTPEADVWSMGRSLQEPVDIQVPPHHVTSFQNHFQSHNIPHETFIHNVQEKINRVRRSVPTGSGTFDKYHNYTTIMAWLSDKVVKCPQRCSLLTIGRSTEDRDLNLIKIGTPSSTHTKPKLWIDAGIHAREWIAPATAMYIIERLIEDYDDNSIVRGLVDKYDWYIMPVINADGYVYSWDKNRLWRKTRSYDNATGCYGVDANRNFDYKWMTIGASSDACSNIYAGPTPFSEPETKAMGDFILAQDWKLYLSFHSFKQLWMLPWGYTMTHSDTHDILLEKGDIAVQKLHSVHGTNYTLGTASSILYESSGTSRDWAYGNHIPYVYTVELRDTGEHGFLLPPDQIKPCAEEVWAGVEAMVSSL